jgi:hypothetical protein
MTDQPQSPFVPGARVAIYTGDRHTAFGYREDYVHKVGKTGRFTLRSDTKQQWRPCKPYSIRAFWTADQTGDHGWSGGGSLRIWDEANDAEITATIARRRRFEKFDKLKMAIGRISFSDLITDELLDQFEIVVLGVKPIPKEKPERLP